MVDGFIEDIESLLLGFKGASLEQSYGELNI